LIKAVLVVVGVGWCRVVSWSLYLMS